MEIKLVTGKEICTYLDIVATMRLQYFREFPYLYEGSLEAEKNYIRKLALIPDALLTVALMDEKVIGFCTGVPLKSDYDSIKEAKTLFINEGVDPTPYFYYGEMIVLPAFRNAKTLLSMAQAQDAWCKARGFIFSCFLTVMRKLNDLRFPKKYRSLEPIWLRGGYKRMQLSIFLQWPTIQLDGSVEEKVNELEFWEKKI